VVTSLKKHIKVAAQSWHLQRAYEAERIAERQFVDHVDNEHIEHLSVEERLGDIAHSISYASFGRPELRNLPQWRAFFAFRHDLAFSDVARASAHSELDDPFCTMCEAGFGSLEHYLSECQADKCVNARQTAQEALRTMCERWHTNITIPRIVSCREFLSEWEVDNNVELISTRGHLSLQWVWSIYGSLYVDGENPTDDDIEEASLFCFKVLEVFAEWHLELRRTVCVAIAHVFSGNHYGENDDDSS
jgi:hypothetical protein